MLSLSSIFGGHSKSPTLSDSENFAPSSPTIPAERPRKLTLDSATPQASSAKLNEFAKDSPSPTSAQQQRNRSDSQASRPMSMIQTYSPAMMDTSGDTLPELQPVFTFLNSHSNKLYQEGYFLKLHDLDSRTFVRSHYINALVLMRKQAVDRAWSVPGQSVLRSWLVLCFHYGMQQLWTQRARRARFSPHLST